MANNVAVTAGSGTTMATDDVAGVHYPYVKLAQGADNTATVVSSADPLPVTVSSGTINLDDSPAISVKGNTVIIRTALTVEATPDYSDGDMFAGEISLTNAVRETSGGLVLNSITIWNDDATTPAFRIMFFDADLTGGTYTENSAPSFSAADKANILGVVPIRTGLNTAGGDWYAAGGDTWACVRGLGLPLQADATQDLRMMIIAGETINVAATGSFAIVLGCLRD